MFSWDDDVIGRPNEQVETDENSETLNKIAEDVSAILDTSSGVQSSDQGASNLISESQTPIAASQIHGDHRSIVGSESNSKASSRILPLGSSLDVVSSSSACHPSLGCAAALSTNIFPSSSNHLLTSATQEDTNVPTVRILRSRSSLSNTVDWESYYGQICWARTGSPNW